MRVFMGALWWLREGYGRWTWAEATALGVHERPLVGVGGLVQRPLHGSRRFSSLLPPNPHCGTGSVLDLTKDPSEFFST